MNTTRATPIYYRVTGLWGAHEGSLLLAVMIFASNPFETRARVDAEQRERSQTGMRVPEEVGR